MKLVIYKIKILNLNIMNLNRKILGLIILFLYRVHKQLKKFERSKNKSLTVIETQL